VVAGVAGSHPVAPATYRNSTSGLHVKKRLLLAAAILWAALIVLLVSLLVTRSAEAHASLVRSTPTAGAALDQSPNYVEIEFSEQVALAQSDIRVLDASGDRVDEADTHAVDTVPVTLRVTLRANLPEGTYTVVWRNLSDVDGHTQSGSFVFFIGEADLSLTSPTAEEVGGVDLLRAGEAATRWVTLLGLVLLAGVPWGFAITLGAVTPASEATAIRRRLARIAVLGAVAVLVAGGAQLGLKLAETESDVLPLLLDTRWGNAWLLRFVLAAVALAAWASANNWLPRRTAAVVIATGLGSALTLSLASHGAAASGFGLVAGLIDAAHVLATMAWGGGLVAVLAMLPLARRDRDQAALLRSAIPRFSVLGALATFTLAATGIYAAWIHAGSIDALTTDYGRGIVAKVVLLIALIAVAAVNTSWVRRHASQAREAATATRWLNRLLRVEVALIALVLAATAMMTSTVPARQQVEDRARALGVVSETVEDGVTVTAYVQPGRIGPNDVIVEMERNGSPYDRATVVELRTRNLETSFGGEELGLIPESAGRWTAPRRIAFTVDGLHEVAIRIERNDGLDLRHAIRFDTSATRDIEGIDPSRAWWAGVGVLGLVGLAMIAANVAGSRTRTLRGEALGWAGVAVIVVASLLIGRAPEAAVSLNSPIPADAASTERGEAIYVAQCARCHGDGLRGDGPDAGTMRVSDLTLHVPHHTDREHFNVISRGRGAMPGWEDELSEDEIWHVINYLRITAEASAPTLSWP